MAIADVIEDRERGHRVMRSLSEVAIYDAPCVDRLNASFSVVAL
jgi:hypothetical protein